MRDDDQSSEDLKKKISEKVMADIGEFERTRVERTLKVLEESERFADAFAKTLRIFDEALQREGFSPQASVLLLQELVKTRALGL